MCQRHAYNSYNHEKKMKSTWNIANNYPIYKTNEICLLFCNNKHILLDVKILTKDTQYRMFFLFNFQLIRSSTDICSHA